MGLTIGPSEWWYSSIVRSCPLGTELLDGSRVICKAGGVAWIAAPSSTQVCSTWGNVSVCGCIDNPGTELCCICDWPSLCVRMLSCGFCISQWFVPSASQASVMFFQCAQYWQGFNYSVGYWSSTETSAGIAPCIHSSFCGSAAICSASKGVCLNVRAFRCVTY